jgi:hypothetical protein
MCYVVATHLFVRVPRPSTTTSRIISCFIHDVSGSLCLAPQQEILLLTSLCLMFLFDISIGDEPVTLSMLQHSCMLLARVPPACLCRRASPRVLVMWRSRSDPEYWAADGCRIIYRSLESSNHQIAFGIL